MQTSSVLFVAGLLFAAASPAQALQYKLSPLPVAASPSSEAWAINNAGTVLGLAQLRYPQAVVWEQGTVRPLSHDLQSYGRHGVALGLNGGGTLIWLLPSGLSTANARVYPARNSHAKVTFRRYIFTFLPSRTSQR